MPKVIFSYLFLKTEEKPSWLPLPIFAVLGWSLGKKFFQETYCQGERQSLRNIRFVNQ